MTKIQLRRDTAANWTSTNPVLASGEHGIEIPGGLFKIGNGTTAWNGLPYAGGGSGYTPGGTDVAITDGGTGASTATAALANLLPTQTGHAGESLTTNGTTTSWAVGSGNPAASTHAATAKTTPVDADELPLADSAASFGLKKLTIADLKTLVNALISTALTAFGSSASALTNKTIALGSNTVSGTLAQFNTALTGADFAQAQRVVTGTSTATPSIDLAATDVFVIPSLAVNVTGITLTNTGSATPEQPLRIVFNPTATRTLAFGSQFEGALLPTSAPGTTRLDAGFYWNAITSKMKCIGVA